MEPSGHPCEVPIVINGVETVAHRSPFAPENIYTDIKLDGVTTLRENWQRSVRLYAEKPFSGYRTKRVRNPDDEASSKPYVLADTFTTLTYAEFDQKIDAVASGLCHRGVVAGDKVVICAANRPEWALIQQACYRNSFVSVPLYDSLGVTGYRHVIHHSESSVVCVEAPRAGSIAAALDLLKEEAGDGELCVKHVVLLSDEEWFRGDQELLQATCSAVGVSFIRLPALETLGHSDPAPPEDPTPATLCSIIYTSGTTGAQKGAVMSHGALATAVIGFYQAKLAPLYMQLDHKRYISYLPLAHVLERVVFGVAVFIGAHIHFYSGHVEHLLGDIGIIKPHVMLGVPRVYCKIYEGIGRLLAKHKVVNALFRYALRDQHEQYPYAASAVSRFILGKVRQRMGGSMELLICGGAPISEEVQCFMRETFGCRFICGYGLTETCAATTVQHTDQLDVGNVGVPTPNAEIALYREPGMDLPDDGRGEILVNGTSIFSGYYKDPEGTADAFLDGWFRTGDIGRWDDKNCLQIVGRCKEIFKLQQGEYVAPERLESMYCEHNSLETMYIPDITTVPFLVSIVVPSEEQTAEWDSVATPVAEREEALLAEIKNTAKRYSLHGYEVVRRVHIAEEFTVENNLMTVTMKIRRNAVKVYYEAEIAAMVEAEVVAHDERQRQRAEAMG
ncbi:hypothetical protein KIPB_005005 [Kipferlia bialata]|uniref:AMP-dependent synthetase/ligase domain-containing protein n=1 Tax=Kipferlia bialata TaxID=797122 RepID=A0A9K3GIQ6_9EUKA|nr:hypothetical protein KIPB_003850 [Kipferlia bialata]GIQ83651.1 hypothetical protein KIPB_005005 [Kipferlia bialata]|eukprot:g3850.t1